MGINRNGRQPEKVNANGRTGSHAAANVCSIFAEVLIVIPLSSLWREDPLISVNYQTCWRISVKKLNECAYLRPLARSLFILKKIFPSGLYHVLRSKSRVFYLILGRKTFDFFLPKFLSRKVYIIRDIFVHLTGQFVRVVNLHILWVNKVAGLM